MTCPKCEIGNLKKVMLKKTQEISFLCDYCETVWSKDEEVNVSTGRQLAEDTGFNDLEYVLGEAEEKDQEHRDAMFPRAK